MKGTAKFILGTSIVSTFFLLYLHIYISLFSVSYDIQRKSHEMTRNHEYFRQLNYEINQLKSPSRLAQQMEKHSFELELPSEVYILQVPESRTIVAPRIDSSAINPLSHGVMEFLGQWVKIAQAKTDSK